MEETQSAGSEVSQQCNNFTDTSRELSNLATSSNILSYKSSAKTEPIIVVDQKTVSESESDSESDNNVDEMEIRIDKQNTISGNEDQVIASTNSSFSDNSSIISSVEPNGSNNLAKTNNIPTAKGTIRNMIPADSSLCNLLVYGNSSDEEDDDVDSENDQSADSYSCDSDNAQNDEVEIVQCSTSQMSKPTKVRKISPCVGKAITSMGELSLDDLPPVPDLSTIQIDDVSTEECDEMGKIASVVDTLVMVESFPNKPAYDVDTLLFLDGGRQPLGYIFDVIGPVAAPMYAIRFNNTAEIALLNISRGAKVFSAPKSAKHTQYAFVQQLLASKGTDASWREDNELPNQSDVDGGEVPSDFEPDFSDDEQELEAARQRRFQNQRGGSKQAAALMAGSRRLKHKRNSLERHKSFEQDMNKRNVMDTNIHRLRESYYEATTAPPTQKRHAPNHHFRHHMHQPPIGPPPPPPPRHGFPPLTPAAFAHMQPPPFPPPPVCGYGPMAAPPLFHAGVHQPPAFLGMGPPPTFQVPPAAFLSRLGPPGVVCPPPPRTMNPFAVVGPPPPRFGSAVPGNAVGQWKPCSDPSAAVGRYPHMMDMKMRPPHQLAVAAAAAAAAAAPHFMFMPGTPQQPPPPPPPVAGFLFYDPRGGAPMGPWHQHQRPPPHQYHQHPQQQHQQQLNYHNQKAGPAAAAASAGSSHFYPKRS